MKITIKRDDWLHGEGSGMLYRPSDGKRCCLGFALKERGVEDATMENINYPHLLANTIREVSNKCDWMIKESLSPVSRFKFVNSDDCGRAAEINDRIGISDIVREETITKIFADNGDEVVFV